MQAIEEVRLPVSLICLLRNFIVKRGAGNEEHSGG